METNGVKSQNPTRGGQSLDYFDNFNPNQRPPRLNMLETFNRIGQSSHWNEVNNTRNNLMMILNGWGKYYHVQAEVKHFGSFQPWENVFQLTTGRRHCLGCRLPGLWIKDGKEFHISASDINGNPNHWVSFPMKRRHRYKIDIKQSRHGNGKALYQIFIDGNLKHQVVNNSPRNYNNVKVYVSNPWLPTFEGILWQLCISANSQQCFATPHIAPRPPFDHMVHSIPFPLRINSWNLRKISDPGTAEN